MLLISICSVSDTLNMNTINTFAIKTTLLIFLLLTIGCSSTPDSVPLSDANYCLNTSHVKTETLTEYLKPYREKMKHQTGTYVLEQGAEAMMSRAWLAERAEKSIDIQYFIFSVDNIGLIATDYLVRAAERGVKVRVLVDDIMVQAKGDELLMLAAHDNIDIKIYNPNANIGKNIIDKFATVVFNFHKLNQRMHNKVFIVDNQLAITGGRNIADEYFGFDHTYNFRDRDVFLAGKVVSDITSSFKEFWQSDLSVPVEELLEDNPYDHNPEFTRLHSYACDPQNFNQEIRAEIEKVPETFEHLAQEGSFLWLDKVEYVSDKPGKNDGQHFLGGGGMTQDKLVELADAAQKSITIQTPYLVTTASDRAFLKSLVDRGVEINILTNSLASNDNLEAFSGYQRDRNALLSTGVNIYEFKPDAKIRHRVMTDHMFKKLPIVPIFGLHAKTMTVDDKITVIGSYNFDPRSKNLNTECITVIYSPQITQQVKANILLEMEPDNAWRISEDFNPDHTVNLSKRFGVKIRRIVPKNIL
ncbi:phospholipase D-like domain-containing protein [Vibrio mangrovi]|nr:phospholipase D family protein [Vibrio mangrovi]